MTSYFRRYSRTWQAKVSILIFTIWLIQATWLGFSLSGRSQEHLTYEDLSDSLIPKETLNSSRGKLLKIRHKEISNRDTVILNLSLNIGEVRFPKIVHIESYNQDNADIMSKKYVYVLRPYWEQLTQSMRSVLALVVQGSFSGRSVVAPMVKDSRFGTKGYPIDYYFDRNHIKDVLQSQGHPDMVDPEEFHKECSPNDPKYTTVHFLYDQKKSEIFTKKFFKVDNETYSKVSLEAKKTGWAKCSFIGDVIKQSPGSRMFCVDTTVVTDWKIFERDVIKSPKCLSVVLWRGIGDTFRARFKETDKGLKFSSYDLFLSLKPSDVVMGKVEKFQRKFLASKYIAVQIRGEYVAIQHGLARLEQCIHLFGYVLKLVKKLFNVDKVFVATDMSKFGSGSWKDSVKRDTITDETLPRLQNLVLSVTNGVSFERAIDNDISIDRGLVAIIELSLVSQARSLLTIGYSSFHEWAVSQFLEFHRKESPMTWSLVKICFDKN